MYKDKVIREWRGDNVSREEWLNFVESDAYERGRKVLEVFCQPTKAIGTDAFEAAQQHAFWAGFKQCMFLFENLTEIHKKTVQEHADEWKHYQAGLESEEPTNPHS